MYTANILPTAYLSSLQSIDDPWRHKLFVLQSFIKFAKTKPNSMKEFT